LTSCYALIAEDKSRYVFLAICSSKWIYI